MIGAPRRGATATMRFSLYERDDLMREAGQARVDRLAAMREIGLDRLVAFPTRWSPTLEAQVPSPRIAGKPGSA